jgi:glutathione synthase/RimK-type ligase-like ATP-grasp enzyme
MRDQQLILSPFNDPNAAAASWGLRKSGYRPVWSQSASLADDAIGPVSLQSDGQSLWQPKSGLDASRFGSVWYRWPRVRKHFQDAMPCDEAFIGGEWRLLQENIYSLSDELLAAFWVNPPAASVRAENKVVQLQEAVRCGLRHPPTLISNDPDRIRQFIRSNRSTIYKPFQPHGWTDQATGKTFDTPAAIVDESIALDDRVLALCPGIYQAYVEKTCDLRVTIIGDRFFPIRIRSRSKGAFVDWRPAAFDMGDVLAEACELPAVIEEKLKTLMGRLGIVYGAVDLVVDANGDVHFLEVNQVGQFIFVERWVESLPLLQAMCAMLAEGRPDYSLGTCSGVSFKKFLVSEEHEHWREQASNARSLEGGAAPGPSLEGRAPQTVSL